jgi:hypothetical protein
MALRSLTAHIRWRLNGHLGSERARVIFSFFAGGAGTNDTCPIAVEVLGILEGDLRLDLVSFGSGVGVEELHFFDLAAASPLFIGLDVVVIKGLHCFNKIK